MLRFILALVLTSPAAHTVREVLAFRKLVVAHKSAPLAPAEPAPHPRAADPRVNCPGVFAC